MPLLLWMTMHHIIIKQTMFLPMVDIIDEPCIPNTQQTKSVWHSIPYITFYWLSLPPYYLVNWQLHAISIHTQCLHLWPDQTKPAFLPKRLMLRYNKILSTFLFNFWSKCTQASPVASENSQSRCYCQLVDHWPNICVSWGTAHLVKKVTGHVAQR